MTAPPPADRHQALLTARPASPTCCQPQQLWPGCLDTPCALSAGAPALSQIQIAAANTTPLRCWRSGKLVLVQSPAAVRPDHRLPYQIP